MNRSLCVAVIMSFAVASPALADLKCGDGKRSSPFAFRPNELVTTWAGPIPQKAKVKITTSTPFDVASRSLGPEFPSGYPAKYLQNLKQVDIFNQTIAVGTQQLIDVQKRHGMIIDASDDALPIFEKYAKANHDFIFVLVQHPATASPSAGFTSCSVVLQRGVIEYADGNQTLYLRSYFHSTNGKGEFVNFTPKGGLEISFASPDIWFPLSLTKVIPEPASFVVLDILTPRPLDARQVPAPFKAATQSRELGFDGRRLFGTRIMAKFDSGKDLEDFRLKP